MVICGENCQSIFREEVRSGIKGSFSEKHGKFIFGTGRDFHLCWQTGG